MSFSSSYSAKPPTTTFFTTMPCATTSSCAVTSSGSFVMRSSTHNQDGFTSAHDNLTHPYPHYEDNYAWSSSSDIHDEEFTDLGLNDSLVAQRRVTRRKLERLQLTLHQGSLLSWGVQPHWEQREPYNVVLVACIGYTASCGVRPTWPSTFLTLSRRQVWWTMELIL